MNDVLDADIPQPLETGSDLVQVSVRRPDEGLFRRSQELLTLAQDYKIVSAEELLSAGEDLRVVKATIKGVDSKRVAITGPLNKALKEANALFRPALDWLAAAEKLLKRKMADYTIEQERIARETMARLEAEARAERERLEAEALAAIDAGEIDQAEELLVEAESQAAPEVKPATPKVEGVAMRPTWKAELVDKAAFIRHVVDHRPDLLTLVEIRQSGLNDLARAQKEALDLPGVKVVRDLTVAARS